MINNEKLEYLWNAAADDLRDLRIRQERLRLFGSVWDHTPRKYDYNPLIDQQCLVDITWKYVFAILLDTERENIKFTCKNDYSQCDLYVYNEKLLSCKFKPYNVKEEAC